jgi:hypothetical protein
MDNAPDQQPDNNNGNPPPDFPQPNAGDQNDPMQNPPDYQQQDVDPNAVPNANPGPWHIPTNQQPAQVDPGTVPIVGNQQQVPVNNLVPGVPPPVPGAQNHPNLNPVLPAPNANQHNAVTMVAAQAAAQAFQQAAANFAMAQAAATANLQQHPQNPPVVIQQAVPGQMPPPPPLVLPPLPFGALPPFSLFPGHATNAPLNLRTSPSDIKLYNKAIEGLPNKYDLSPVGLQQFLSSVLGRVIAFGWERTINVPDAIGIIRNLIISYGLLTATDIMAYILTYFHLETKEAQDSVMMYQFLINSLTIEARTEMCVYEDQYLIDYVPAPGATPIKIGSGACLLKAIIGKAVLDTMASVNTLRAAIRNLDKKLVELQSNIKQFNHYVSQQKTGLTARGEAVPELLMSLFEAYLGASDESFVEYIRIRQYSHIDGSAPLTPEKLMALALAQYEYYLDQGTWNAPTKKDKKIIALTAEVNKLRKVNKAGDTITKRPRQNNDKYAWKKDKPKGKERTKTMGKKTYHWCKWHQAWVIHDPTKCTLAHKKGNNKSNDDDANAVDGKMKALTIDPALQAEIADDSDEDYGFE